MAILALAQPALPSYAAAAAAVLPPPPPPPPPSPEHTLRAQHLLSLARAPSQDRVRMAAQVSSALAFLHSAPQPIIHMDLKPGNVLLSKALDPKVALPPSVPVPPRLAHV